MSLDQLYQQIILDPLCGDEVTLRLDLSGTLGTDVVRDLSWTGDGCAISQASTSTLHDLVVGRPLDEAADVVAAFREMVRSRGELTPDEARLGDAAAFAGVGRHANRVKCAMLGWTAYEAALAEAQLSQPNHSDPVIEETR
jgi:nitrogen fixation protein NifU and related proteins